MPRANPTHFLCIPLSSTQLRRSLASFAADVTSIQSFALPPDAIRPAGTLHLTLGVMSLPRPDQVEQALTLLRQIQVKDIVSEARSSGTHAATHTTATNADAASAAGTGSGPQPGSGKIIISIKGLHAMQTPSRTTVLYAPPVDSEGGMLYEVCKSIKRRFTDSGLMIDEGRALLLHTTVVNTRYVKGSGRGSNGKRMELDARDILSKYEDYEWADGVEVSRLALCKMGAKKDGDDAFYEEEGYISF